MKRETLRKKERLNKLADHLENSVLDKEYNHGSYCGKNLCRTTHCALGHAAATKGKFPGLQLDFDQFGVLINLTGSWCDEDIEADRYFGDKAYRTIFGGGAFKSYKPKRKTVIKRIRQFSNSLQD
jgi:hypothetical protein